MNSNVRLLNRKTIEKIIAAKGGIDDSNENSLKKMLFCAILMAAVDGHLHRREWDTALLFLSDHWEGRYGDAKNFVKTVVRQANLLRKHKPEINRIISIINSGLNARQKRTVLELAELIMQADGRLLASESDLLIRFKQQFGKSLWLDDLKRLKHQAELEAISGALFNRHSLKSALYCAFLLSLLDEKMDRNELDICTRFLSDHWAPVYGNKKDFLTETLQDAKLVFKNKFLINKELNQRILAFNPSQKITVLNLAKKILSADDNILETEAALLNKLKKALTDDLKAGVVKQPSKKQGPKPEINRIISELFAGNDPSTPLPYETIDRHVDRIPPEFEESLESLVAYLIHQSDDDEDVCRSIFYWIANNIDYDVYAFYTKNIVFDEVQPETVLKTRRAMCYGSSLLFERLAKLAGLKAETIIGYSKTDTFQIGDRLKKPNHAWNSVNINGKWQLMDVTWAAGTLVDKQFLRQFQEDFFMQDPEQFILSHFPEDPQWQLLEKAISLRDFEEMPALYQPYFQYRIKTEYNQQGTLNIEGNHTIVLETLHDLVLRIELFDAAGAVPGYHHLIHRHAGKFMIELCIPQKGKYQFNVFCRKKEEKQFRLCVGYKLNVTSRPDQIRYFPRLYDAFYENDVRLHSPSPSEGLLQPGQTCVFRITVPGAETVSLVMSGQQDWIELKKSGQIFEQEIMLGHTLSVELCARYPQNEDYLKLVRFKVAK